LYNLTITQKSTYLHATVTGSNTEEDVSDYLEEIRRECIVRGYSRILIEERLEGLRLGTVEVFRLASEGADHSLGQFQTIAYVDVNAKGDLMRFAETVAVNRGLPVRVFSSVSDAEEWLLSKAHGDIRQHHFGDHA